jgi:hypothetical protein
MAILRDLHRVEAKFCFQVRRLALGIADGLSILRAQLGILDSNGLVDRGVTGDVCCIVRQCAQREGVLVDILALEQHLTNKVSAAKVMHQVAEFLAAERIVTQILDDSASVGVGVRFFKVVFRQSGISLEQKRPDLVGPEQVDDLLVRQNGVRRRAPAAHEHNEKKCHRADRKPAPTRSYGP